MIVVLITHYYGIHVQHTLAHLYSGASRSYRNVVHRFKIQVKGGNTSELLCMHIIHHIILTLYIINTT